MPVAVVASIYLGQHEDHGHDVFSGVLPAGEEGGSGTSAQNDLHQPRVVLSRELPNRDLRRGFVDQPGRRLRPPGSQLTGDVPQQQRRPLCFGRFSFAGACAVEAMVVVPTIMVESALAGDPWSLILRIVISCVRLAPLVVPCVVCSFGTLRRCMPRAPRCVPAHVLERFSRTLRLVLVVIFCPEVRWGLAITLDMWYLLTTPLNKGFARMPYVLLLVLNIMLCFVDTLTLIMLLAIKSNEDFDVLEPVYMEVETGMVRPQPVKIGQVCDHGEVSSKFDPTCVICLSEFTAEDEVMRLPCDHIFHTECIATWLTRSRHCPLRCPQVVLPPMVVREPQEEEVLLPFQTPMTVDGTSP